MQKNVAGEGRRETPVFLGGFGQMINARIASRRDSPAKIPGTDITVTVALTYADNGGQKAIVDFLCGTEMARVTFGINEEKRITVGNREYCIECAGISSYTTIGHNEEYLNLVKATLWIR